MNIKTSSYTNSTAMRFALDIHSVNFPKHFLSRESLQSFWKCVPLCTRVLLQWTLTLYKQWCTSKTPRWREVNVGRQGIKTMKWNATQKILQSTYCIKHFLNQYLLVFSIKIFKHPNNMIFFLMGIDLFVKFVSL